MMHNDKLRRPPTANGQRPTANGQRRGTFAPLPPQALPGNSLYQKQLTTPADRSVRAAAGAFAVSTGVAAGSVWCRPSPRSFTGHRNCPGSPLATPPALPAIQTRCCADRHPVWVVTQVPMSAERRNTAARCAAAPPRRAAKRVAHPILSPGPSGPILRQSPKSTENGGAK